MTLLAGLDVGNATTELVLADVAADGRIALRWHGRRATAGHKGSGTSLEAAARMLHEAERELGARCASVGLAELRPVTTATATLPPRAPQDTGVLRIAGPGVATPAGAGVAHGRHVPLDALGEPPTDEEVVVSVLAGTDFDDAGRALTAALARGWRIVGVIAGGDDAVLIHNRIPIDVPIVDEVDLAAVRPGERVAVEVARAGGTIVSLSDPLGLAAALALSPDRVAALGPFAREVADARALVVVARATPDPRRADGAVLTLEVDGDLRDLGVEEAIERLRTLAPGRARRLRIAGTAVAGLPDPFEDLFVVDLGHLDDGAWLRRGIADLDGLPLAALAADAPLDPADLLAELVGRPVRTLGSEAALGASGARSTPLVPEGAGVCDLGGGTVDCSCRGATVTAAGAGELVTASVGLVLGLPRGLAERVKRRAAIRVDAPSLAHLEDGSRSFLERPAPQGAVGRLCVPSRDELLPFSDRLAPEEWRSLRLAIKREVIGANVERCLAALPTRPETLLLAGGGACDEEATRIVADRLRTSGVTVARANVGGVLGPRYAVAYGVLDALACSPRVTS